MRFHRIHPLLAGLATLAIASAAMAAPRTLGQFRDWAAYVSDDGGARVCYLYSEPKKSEGDYTRRGETYVQVANRPAEAVRNEVSVTAGYTYRDGSTVEIIVGRNHFELFTDRSNAWAREGNTDQRIVAAMKAGTDMIVKGTSSRGTLTTDTYSLLGFTAAHRAMESACRR
jgi:hypothetical protein